MIATTIRISRTPGPRSIRGRFIVRQRDTTLDRWRIMALLVEALFRRQIVRSHDCRPPGVPVATVRAILLEAGMEQITPATWLTGLGTYEWLTFWYHGVPHV